MSPEQGSGHQLDHRSDIYALGVILYEMVTGRTPYDAETPLTVIMKHVRDPLPLPRILNPALPEAVERVILKALAKQPEDRFTTAGNMVQALQAAIPDARPMAGAGPTKIRSSARLPIAQQQVADVTIRQEHQKQGQAETTQRKVAPRQMAGLASLFSSISTCLSRSKSKLI